MLAVAQYLIYFFVGALFLFFVAAFFSVAAGFGIMALVLLFLPIFLAEYASGLSLFFPRISAIVGIILVLPFFILCVYSIFAGAIGFNPTHIIAPASVVILISIFALLWNNPSIWSRQEEVFSKVIIGIFTGVPALIATSMILSSFIKIFT